MLTRIVILGLLVLAAVGMKIEVSPSQEAGFSQGLFDAETIEDLLGRRNCDGVRFYNTMDAGQVYVMAVGISEGADIQGGFFTRNPYAVSKGVVEGRIEIEKINEEKARKMCEEVDRSSHTQYSAHFTKRDLETMLRQRDCNALRIRPASASGQLSMELHAINFTEGEVTELGEGEGFEMLALSPCPPVCGVTGNYIYGRE